MRTSSVLVVLSVVVACSIVQVSAIDCSMVKLESVRNCNECIRCGGSWCNKGEKNPCTSTKRDNWCVGDNAKEVLPSIPNVSEEDATVSPTLYTATATVGRGPRIAFTYKVPHQTASLLKGLEPNVFFINSTQTMNYQIEEPGTIKCDGSGRCSARLTISPETSFCLDNGTTHEYLFVKVRVENVSQETTLKYHVPCACECSARVEKNAAVCNRNGDFSCGVCTCHKDWSGEFCDVYKSTKCEHRRGDVPCTNPNKNEVSCSGNGVCGECDKCICNTEGEGWQYLEPHNYCADLGLVVTSECEECLQDQTVVDGPCASCPVIMQPCNQTLLLERDEMDRKVWVEFTDSTDGAVYAAMKDSSKQIYVMRMSSCKNLSAIVAGNINLTVSTILGAIAVLAVASLVVGYMVWNARGSSAPLSASQYQELDGPENSAGINPLYRAPTSSYKNPLWKGGANV